jgi:hypothetical protein
MNNNFKVGDIVLWWNSHYTIIELVKGGAMLKQNFSIGSKLTKPVSLDELTKVK